MCKDIMSSPNASHSSSASGSPPPLLFGYQSNGNNGSAYNSSFNGNGVNNSAGGTPNSSSGSTASSDDSPKQKKKNGALGIPYIPSYMDLSNGPEPCVVCGDAATGYHYRCMTCEGCKGFFRRTIQKNLQYHCKYNQQCAIDKNTRNQCQQCRFRKCINVGMATDLVLNDRQRVAKRKLIEENRERRKLEQRDTKQPCLHDHLYMTEDDRTLVGDVMDAYEATQIRPQKAYHMPASDKDAQNPEVWRQLNEVLTPSIIKVVEFAKRVPGFSELLVDDQILLLKNCCMEIMLLRTSVRFDRQQQTLSLPNGAILTRETLALSGGLGILIEPIFDFAQSLAKLELDHTEIALLATVLLLQADRPSLVDPQAVELLQDSVLGAYRRYLEEKRPDQPVHWAKILMKVTDLRTISARHAERVLSIKLDKPTDIPPMFLQMFDENEQRQRDVKAEPEDLRLRSNGATTILAPDTPTRDASR